MYGVRMITFVVELKIIQSENVLVNKSSKSLHITSKISKMLIVNFVNLSIIEINLCNLNKKFHAKIILKHFIMNSFFFFKYCILNKFKLVSNMNFYLKY
jgi:hypothetical protein